MIDERLARIVLVFGNTGHIVHHIGLLALAFCLDDVSGVFWGLRPIDATLSTIQEKRCMHVCMYVHQGSFSLLAVLLLDLWCGMMNDD